MMKYNLVPEPFWTNIGPVEAAAWLVLFCLIAALLYKLFGGDGDDD